MTAALRWWFRPAPAERLAALRILVGAFAFLYLTTRLPMFLGYARFPARDFVPLGVTRILEQPLSAAAHTAILVITVVLAAAFVAGVWYRVTAPLFAALLLWVLTYRSSWGMPFHTENLLVLHVIVLALAPAADAWSVDARRRGASSPSEAYGWPLRLMAALTCLTYVLAGIAKLRLGGLAWAEGDFLRDQVAVDNLRKVLLGADASPLATPLLEHAWLFEVMAFATLAIELGAPVALAGGRVALAWALLAWGFHVGVVALMAIVFPYPLVWVAYAPLFAAERPMAWVIGKVQARARR
ncbi:MAG: HTTM domain-containing protein [Deltaproteobacteria bacterium]|nr:HTTM domain-containing protein [Kofleriaceae bacterium]